MREGAAPTASARHGLALRRIGAMGIVMPLFPTTPFLLVAVWAFSRSSPEMAEKIRNHPIAGAYIRDWEDDGVIPPAPRLSPSP